MWGGRDAVASRRGKQKKSRVMGSGGKERGKGEEGIGRGGLKKDAFFQGRRGMGA